MTDRPVDRPVAPDPVGASMGALARRYWWFPVLRGVLCIAFGLVAVIWPHATVHVILWVIAIFAIVDGLVGLVDAIRYRRLGGTALGIVLGLLSVGFGVVALVWPGPTITVFAVVVGIWAIIAGLIGLVAAIDLRAAIGSGWVWGVVSSAVTILLGVLLLVWPKSSLAALVWLVGVWAIVVGIVLLFVGFRVRRLGQAERTV